MSKYLLTFSLLLSILTTTQAQETVFWANEVIDVSSEYSPLEYSALQVLHKPNVLPAGGDNPNAWRANNQAGKNFIMVSFEQRAKVRQIAIAESENPGAITKVLAYDADYNEYTLFELTPKSIPIESRLLNLFFEETPYEVEAIRVELDGKSIDGYNAIDAIGISNSNIPINVLINIAQNVNQDIQADKLSKNVNSTYIEHSPLLSPDGRRLYFSRQYHPDNIGGVDDNEDIWYSEQDAETGEWLPAKNIGAPLNNSGPNFISSITQVGDETILLLGNRYESKGRMVSGVSMATIDKDGNVSKPKNIDIEDDYNYSANADFYIADNQEVMLMAVERDDTYGSRDLYVSFKKKNDDWTAPQNLGTDLNTVAEEASPFLAEDQTTLYFSSNGYSGYGKKDIFVSKRLDDSWLSWSEPENLGKGINTKGDDVYFNIPSSGKHIYFTRGDVDEDTDIFSFKADDFFVTDEDPIPVAEVVPVAPVEEKPVEETDPVEEKPVVDVTTPVAETPVETTPVAEVTPTPVVEEKPKPVVEEPKEVFITVRGNVLNEKTNQPLAAKVLVERLPDGIDIGQVKSDPVTGAYEFTLRPGARYGFRAEADGYLAEDENVDLNEVSASKTIEQTLYLAPIEKGVSIVFNNIFFDFDKDILKTASYPELERVLELLKSKKIDRIEISGHTDSMGPEAYNVSLSKKRANRVYNYFINKGIDKGRLEVVAHGETKPTHPNDTITNRKKNRRVEFKVLQVQ